MSKKSGAFGPGSGFADVLGDIFPFLTELIVQDDEVCVENIIDALYGYGTLHGHTLQTKVEQSPFYTKHYKKITVKQQQQLRAGKEANAAGVPSEDEESSEEEEEKQKEKKSPTPAKARGKQKKSVSKKSPGTVGTINSKSFVGVTSPTGAGSGKDGDKALFEATIIIGQRKVNVGQFNTAREAAQAYDRALIRANGPSNCQDPGVLNFPLSEYSGDPLSKFSIFDGVLKKQLFGSDWSGPKACDFGFLMTQPGSASSATKRCAAAPGAVASMRRKRHKGQYGDSGSGSDAYPRGPRFENGKRLLYGNYYMMLDEGGDDVEEPYFKSPGPLQQRATKSPPQNDLIDPNQARPGDILVVMHGEKERKAGRPSHERGILLDRAAFAGWLVIGFADFTSRNLRGEQVNILGACEATMKFMKVPTEAIGPEDITMKEHFISVGLLRLTCEQNAQVTNLPLSTTRPPHVNQKAEGIIESVKPAISDAPVQTVSSAPTSPYSHLGIEQEYVNIGINEYCRHYKSDFIVEQISKMNANSADKEEDDPVSLYELAAYGRGVSSTTFRSNQAEHDTASVSISKTQGASQDNDGSRIRPSRYNPTGINAGHGQQSDRPSNFQVFSSGTFGHKMTDLLAGSCFILPQEIALLRSMLNCIVTSKESSSDNAFLDDNRNGTLSKISIETAVSETAVQEICSIAQPRWLLSLLDPASNDSSTMLRSLRQAVAELATGSSAPISQSQPSVKSSSNESTSAGAGTAVASASLALSSTTSSTTAATTSTTSACLQALARRLLSDSKYEGVCDARAGGSAPGTRAVSTESVKGHTQLSGRFTFELPAENKMLMADLGISSAIIAAGMQASADSAEGQQQAGKGSILVGYFSSALEAAMVREQVLGLTKSTFGVNSSYGVDLPRNFNTEEWAELRRVGRLISKFTRKQCMP